MTDINCEEITRIYIDEDVVWYLILLAWFMYIMLTKGKEGENV